MSHNILLVDDDSDFREEFRDYLEDYNVIEASNGIEALKIIKKPNEIDLVILDVMMPSLLGTEVLKEIKMIAPHLPIIILTGYPSKDLAIEALRGHADDYIEKPLNINKTNKIIEKILEHKICGSDINYTDTKGKVDRVKYFIQRNYDKKITLNDAAAAVSLSPKYLSRIFKEIAKKSFSQYRLEAKIEIAKELLKDNKYNISQLSYKIGYKNLESFIRQFKKFEGCSPTEYRKKQKVKS
ncbi:MAG: response regulator [bacterium]